MVEIVARTSAGASDLADSTRPNVAEPGAQSAKRKRIALALSTCSGAGDSISMYMYCK